MTKKSRSRETKKKKIAPAGVAAWSDDLRRELGALLVASVDARWAMSTSDQRADSPKEAAADALAASAREHFADASEAIARLEIQFTETRSSEMHEESIYPSIARGALDRLLLAIRKLSRLGDPRSESGERARIMRESSIRFANACERVVELTSALRESRPVSAPLTSRAPKSPAPPPKEQLSELDDACAFARRQGVSVATMRRAIAQRLDDEGASTMPAFDWLLAFEAEERAGDGGEPRRRRSRARVAGTDNVIMVDFAKGVAPR